MIWSSYNLQQQPSLPIRPLEAVVFRADLASVLNNGQAVADVLWMNSTIAACWDGFLRNWLSSLAGNLLSDKLSTAKPSVLESIHLASFEMNLKVNAELPKRESPGRGKFLKALCWS